MKAVLLLRRKSILSNGAILEMVIWRLPSPVVGSAHAYKYRLFYGQAGLRVVGYDNERPKGDHRHLDGIDAPYEFTSVEGLVRDFLADVESRRTK